MSNELPTWENPKFEDVSTTSELLGIEADTYDDGPAAVAVDPRAVLAKVLEITKAREIAAEQKLQEERPAAADEIDKTIDMLVDWLVEIDYPGATIVDSLMGKPDHKGRVKRDQQIEIPLWLLDSTTAQRYDLPRWGFGPDRQLYTPEELRMEGFAYRCYVPVDIRSKEYIKEVFEVRDALDRFEVPTEDSLLQ